MNCLFPDLELSVILATMKHQKLKTIRFDQISILEWHDGMIRGIGMRTSTIYLFMLVAWDLVSAKRAYVLLQLERSIADEMIRLTDIGNAPAKTEKWNEFNRCFEEYINNYGGECFVTFQEPVVGKTLVLERIGLEILKKVRNYQVEKAVSTSAVRFWIGKSNRLIVR